MLTIRFHIKYIHSHSFTTRLYVHNLLSHSGYMFTFFRTPTICSQPSFTLRIYVHILSHPQLCVHNLLSHSAHMLMWFCIPTICSQCSSIFSMFVHILSHPDYMLTVFFHTQNICSHSADYWNVSLHSEVTSASDCRLLPQLLPNVLTHTAPLYNTHIPFYAASLTVRVYRHYLQQNT